MFSSRNIMNDGEEAAEVAKQFNFLENTLLKHRTLTIFGEIRQGSGAAHRGEAVGVVL